MASDRLVLRVSSRRRFIRGMFLTALVSGLSATAESARAQDCMPAQDSVQPVYQIDIDRSSLNEGLKQLARQTGIQVARFSDNEPANVLIGPLHDVCTIDQALGRLLSGTELAYRFVNERMVSIQYAMEMAAPPVSPLGGSGSGQTLAEPPSDTGRQSGIGAEAAADHESEDNQGRLNMNSRTEKTEPKGLWSRIRSIFSGRIEAPAKSFWSRLRLASVVTGLVALMPAATRAQETAAGTDPTSIGLDEVVVTATRREESLQKVPIAVTSLSGDQLASSGLTDARQLMQMVPGLTGNRTNIGLQPGIRGVQTSNFSLGEEGAVAVYIDGVYQPEPRANAVDFVNIERVEVLRGPQGTLFGRNATGGLINIITADPKFMPSGRVSVEYGRLSGADEGAARLYGTTGLSDKFAIDGALMLRENGGYIDNLARGGKEGGAKAYEARSKLLFQPSDRGKIVLTVGSGYSEDNSSVSATVLTDASGRALTAGAAVPGAIVATAPYTTSTSIEPDASIRKIHASLRTQLDLGSVILETTSGYGRFRSSLRTDADMSSAAISSGRIFGTTEAFSQEARLLSAAEGLLKWISGVFYFHEKAAGPVEAYIGSAPFLVERATPSQIYGGPPGRLKAEAIAAFAEGTLSVTPRFRLTLGGRQNHETRNRINTTTTFDATGASTTVAVGNRLSQDKFTYRASAQYDLTDRANVYVTHGTGFKSGSFNNGSGPGVITTVEPETIAGFEVGLKADLTNWLRTNVAVFDYDYKNMQVTTRAPSGVGALLLNAAESRLRGLEAEIWARVTDELSLSFSGSYLDAKYTSFPGAQTFTPRPTITTAGALVGTFTDVSGNRLIRAPEYTLQSGFDWRHNISQGEVGANINVFYTAKVYQDFGNYFPIPAHEMINGEFWWSPDGSKLRFALWTTNLTNVRTYQQIVIGQQSAYATSEKPRQIGLRATYNF